MSRVSHLSLIAQVTLVGMLHDLFKSSDWTRLLLRDEVSGFFSTQLDISSISAAAKCGNARSSFLSLTSGQPVQFATSRHPKRALHKHCLPLVGGLQPDGCVCIRGRV